MPCATTTSIPGSEPAEKYLFLDFDGPLHPSTTLQGKNVGLLAASPAALREAGFFIWSDRLEQLLAEAEAAHSGSLRINVIVHSSWRAQPWFSTPVIRQALGALGERICGFTRCELPRGQAVEDLCMRMGIEDYVVLDDDIRAFADCPVVQQHLIAVNPLRGVCDESVTSSLAQWAHAEPTVPSGTPTPSQF